jgi:hypothetical protein
MKPIASAIASRIASVPTADLADAEAAAWKKAWERELFRPPDPHAGGLE